MFDPIDITLTDPRTFDGTPYEVAERSIQQIEAAMQRLVLPLMAARLMARNADMERNLALRMPPAGADYNAGPQGRRFDRAAESMDAAYRDLKALRAAASYDPKNPPR